MGHPLTPSGLGLREAFPEVSDIAFPLLSAYKPVLTHPSSSPHSNGHSGLASQLALVCSCQLYREQRFSSLLFTVVFLAPGTVPNTEQTLCEYY